MADTSQPTFFAARPAIRVDGKVEPLLGDELLQSLLVEENTEGLFRCEADFLNWGPSGDGEGLLLFDKQIIDFGKAFAVEFGPPDNVNAVFAGRITGVEAHYPADRPPELTVLAEDRLQDLRMVRRTRSFENVTDADVFRKIAGDNSLTPQLDLDGPTYKVLAQVNQSDLAFLRERAAAMDAELWVDDKTLYAQQRTRRNTNSVTFQYGQNLLEFSVLADLADQRTTVEVCGWDVSAKASIDEKADEAAISGEINGGRSGSSLLGRAIAERHERIVSATPLSKDEAKRMAESRFRERARRFVRGTGVVDGNVKIRVGTSVELKGLGAVFDGKYYVSLARHTFDLHHGFRTTFEVERPSILVAAS